MKTFCFIAFAMLVAGAAAATPSPAPNNCGSPEGLEPDGEHYYCYGIGEYNISSYVWHTKCPQLNLMQPDHKTLTTIVVRDGDFADDSAIWKEVNITGVGLNGYFYEFENKQYQDYGWLAGVIPDAPPHAGPDGKTSIAVGMEVLCRANQTENQFMEGQIVDPSLDGQWVCKLKDATLPLLPFVPEKDIRPLCFAKDQDYIAAETHWKVHPHPNWREERGMVGASSICTAYCARKIDPDGTCPDLVTLGMEVFRYVQWPQPTPTPTKAPSAPTKAPSKKPPAPAPVAPVAPVAARKLSAVSAGAIEHFYQPSLVDGIFYHTKQGIDDKDFYYTINGTQVAPTWGPQPTGKTGTLDFIVPSQKASGITAETSFGEFVLCPLKDDDPAKAKNPYGYKAGTIFNTPKFTKDHSNHDGLYHVYTCEAQKSMDIKSSISCNTDVMKQVCWPAEL